MASSAYSTFFVRLSKGILALSLLGFGSCQRELLTVNDLDLTLRPGLVVPLGQLHLSSPNRCAIPPLSAYICKL